MNAEVMYEYLAHEYLLPPSGKDLNKHTQNPYNSFPCHKTTENDDESGERYATNESKECAGFLTLRAQNGDEVPEGFEPAYEICYTDIYEMIDAYADTDNLTH